MKKKSGSRSVRRSLGEGGFCSLRVVIALLLCAAAACSVVGGTLLAFFRPEAPAKARLQRYSTAGTVSHPAAAGLTFAERVAYQRAIEEVYWRHRIWPAERPDPKPSLDAVMSQAQLEKKVADYLRNSQALEDYWQRPITGEQLQAEMDRMAEHTKQPELLRAIWSYTNTDSHSYAYSYSYANCNANGDSYPNVNADGYFNSNADSYLDANNNTYT